MKTFLKKLHSALKSAALLPVRVYRKYLSGLKTSPSCRFTPTCSEYAILAVEQWGIIIGFILALWRIVRCNPFSRGGEDLPPTRAEVKKKLCSLFSHSGKST